MTKVIETNMNGATSVFATGKTKEWLSGGYSLESVPTMHEKH